jgi:hypothetical protein
MGQEVTSKFGDKNNKDSLRIGFQNVGGFPSNKFKLKEEVLRRGLVKWDFDIFGMVETNIDWRLMKVSDRLPLRTKEWWDSQHVSWAHNTTGKTRPAR